MFGRRNSIEKKPVRGRGRKPSVFDKTTILTGGTLPKGSKEGTTDPKRGKTRDREGTPDPKDKDDRSPRGKKAKTKDPKVKDPKNDDTTLKDEEFIDAYKLKICIDCSQLYIAHLSNSKIKCISCNSNKHECLETANVKWDTGKTSKGNVWICKECMEDIQKDNNVTKKEDAKEDNINKDKSKESPNQEPKKKTKSKLNVLEYKGVNITAEDVKTLDRGQWVSDEMIALHQVIMEEDKTVEDHGILYVTPSNTFLLKMDKDGKLIDDMKRDWNIRKMRWIFYPINNNNETDKVGGTHWSLLIFNRTGNKYYHYDPIKGMNREHAQALITNTKDNSNGGSDYIEMECPQQKNSFDCGIYTMLITAELTSNIIERSGPKIKYTNEETAINFREEMKDVINHRISKTEKPDAQKSKAKENKEEKINERSKKLNVCKNWSNNKCHEKEKCTNDHPPLCSNWINRGECWRLKTKQCTFFHPLLCWQSIGQGSCRNGNECEYRHINNNSNERKTEITNRENKYNKKEQNICIHYMRGTCKYGKECWNMHPRICNQWREMGRCERGETCTEKHPQECRLLKTKVGCKRHECRNFHPPRRNIDGNKTQQNTGGYNRGSQNYGMYGKSMGNFRLPQKSGTYGRRYQTSAETYKKRHPDRMGLKMEINSNIQREMREAWEKMMMAVMAEMNRANFYV